MAEIRPEDAWPEAPGGATYHDGDHWLDWLEGWRGHGWTVGKEPPGGFPFIGPPYERARYGPPGTTWIFSEADMLAGLVDLPGPIGKTAVNLALRKLGVVLGEGSVMAWQTPAPQEVPSGGPVMRWWHVTIVGKVGTVEQVAHTFNYRTAPAVDVDQSPADGVTFAGQIGAAWTSFLNGDTGTVPKSHLSRNLVYDHVRATYLEQANPAAINTRPGKRGPVKTFTPPRAGVLVPTQFWNFPVGTVGGAGGGMDCPWETALCMSLGTGVRGPRNRGRSYLGPLDLGIMSGGGVFIPDVVAMGERFGRLFINAVNVSSGNRLHIVSRSYATSIGVNSVLVGLVPDSQRRRRKSQPENAVTAWHAAG